MAIADLLTILNSDTLAEGREKINASIQRMNAGEFNDVTINGNLDVAGELTVTRLIQIEAESQNVGSPILTLSDIEGGLASDDGKARGIAFRYFVDGGEKTGFFGRLQTTADSEGRFTYIPDAEIINEAVSGTVGEINAKIDGSNIENVGALADNLNSFYVHASSDQTIQGTKIFTGFVDLDNVNQGTSSNHALPARRSLFGSDGVLIDGFQNQAVQLIQDLTISLDSTVVRTSGNQQISGEITFDSIITSDITVAGTNFDEFVLKTGNQEIFDNKTFRQSAGNDGIRLTGRAGGSSSYFVSFETEILTSDRSITLPDENVTLSAGTMATLDTEQTFTTEKSFTKDILFTDSNTEKRGIEGVIGGEDHWFIGGGAFSEDNGFVELASGKNGDEPIFVRQYVGSPRTGTIGRELILLSSDGSTILPGSLTLGSPGSTTTQAVRGDRAITAGTGLQGGGDFSADRTISVDNTVIRTTGTYNLLGNYTFSNLVNGTIQQAQQLETARRINGVLFDGSEDIQLSTAPAVGGGDNQVFFENDSVITDNYTITAGRNAMSAGPIEIIEGVTITIPDGSTWTIV